MKITTIKKTTTFGNYENISAECEVEEFEDPVFAAEELAEEIDKMIHNIQRNRELKAEELMKKRELDHLKQTEPSNDSDFVDEDIPF
jgi:hypothetical protein